MASVVGFDPNQSGQQPVDGPNLIPVGVWGDSDSGVGVFGSSGALPHGIPLMDIQQVAGVEGHGSKRDVADAPKFGVCGRSRGFIGVQGVNISEEDPTEDGGFKSNSGVFGMTDGLGTNDAGRGEGVRGLGLTNGDGVVGASSSRTGVKGFSSTGIGVAGAGPQIGVIGEAFDPDGFGVIGSGGTQGEGVRGVSAFGRGLQGFGGGAGVEGFSLSGTAVRGSTGGHPLAIAGDFAGSVRVTGFLLKAGGGFEIDHPVDPENMYLAHSFVESPEMLNVYSGTLTTDESGDGEVGLPDYFEALNSDFRYQLTVIGEFAQAIVAREVQNNRFAIRTDRPRIKVCWQVTGVRRDRWAQANRVKVESTKSEPDRGRYLHPAVWDQAAEGIQSWADEARRQAIEMMPESLRERWEALLASDSVDQDELQQLIDEAGRFPDRPERPSWARLEQDLRVMQEEVARRMGIGDEAG
jgi:hypothetical protein